MSEKKEKIILELNRQSARSLYDLIYGLGEYFAAGAPFHPSFKRDQDLNVIFESLRKDLGIQSIAEAMQETLDKKEKIS